MQLFIIRHAWAEDIDEAPGMRDETRRLTREGTKRFRKFAKRLLDHGLAASAIATSPLVRCRETADILSEVLPNNPPIEELASLAPGASLDQLTFWTQPHVDANRSAIWVGHAPDVGRLTAQMTGDRHGYYQFKKGAVALLEVNSALATNCARLVWLYSDGTLDD